MQVIQVKLQCENVHMQTYVDFRFKKKTIKAGIIIELKEDPRLWTVEEVFGKARDSKSLHRGWNNNI